MWILLLFILVPLIEIGLFIQVGGWLGLWPTLGIVVLTAIAGTYLVKSQGIATLQSLQGRLDRFQDPTDPLAHGAFILFAGALLLTPGFFTDAAGFTMLVPTIRQRLIALIKQRAAQKTADPTIIETTYFENTEANDQSPWQKD